MEWLAKENRDLKQANEALMRSAQSLNAGGAGALVAGAVGSEVETLKKDNAHLKFSNDQLKAAPIHFNPLSRVQPLSPSRLLFSCKSG